MSGEMHPLAPHSLPAWVPEAGQTDALMVASAIFLLVAILSVGLIYLKLHSLPEHMAHKGQKIQYEIVAVLGLIALFTHQHIFWIAALLIALVDLPDFGSPLGSMARSLERLSGREGEVAEAQAAAAPESVAHGPETSDETRDETRDGARA
jgi:hypothetical protein